MIQQQKRSHFEDDDDDEGRDPSILLALKRFRSEKQNNPSPSMFHDRNEGDNDDDDDEREAVEGGDYGGEREVDESNLNEDAMMRQLRSYGQYSESSRIMISAAPVSEPLFATGDMPSNVVFSNNVNTAVDHNPSDPSLSMRSRTESLYPWLLVINEPCHSEKQVASGKDLSDVKKKYKRMFCVYCAEYNPYTPWAKWKARKFEKENLDDHERSIHHQKTLLAREKAGMMNSIVPPAESFQNMNMIMPMGESSGISLTAPLMSTSFQLPLLSKLTEHDLVAMEHGGKEITGQHQHGAGSLINRVAIANSLIPTINMPMGELSDDLRLVPNVHPYPGHVMPNPSMMTLYPYPSSLIPGTSGSSQTFLDTVYNTAWRPRSKYAPDWLRVQGKLSFSDRQRDGNKDLSKAKKKYKLVMCAYCAEFNPSAPWATMRYRKFETAVLLEHEKSSFHKKARELRDRMPGQPNGLCDLTRWEVSESSCSSLNIPSGSP